MAGDWIKVETTTPDKPEVFRIAEALNIDPDAALGKLIRVWVWADQQTYDGNAESNATSVTRSLLDRLTGVTGFASAMEAVGWLAVTDEGLIFPRFQDHNGQSAKRRALTALDTTAVSEELQLLAIVAKPFSPIELVRLLTDHIHRASLRRSHSTSTQFAGPQFLC